MKKICAFITRYMAVIVLVVAGLSFLMPLLAVLLSKIFALPTELAIGVALVGCCPGGTSSNVITYLSKGDVALSVGMQNSGLACSIAATHFPALAMAAVPGAVFSVWHNISGALVAKLFSKRN